MPSPSDTDDAALADWCDAMARALDLPIDAANRAEIIASLQMIARQIRLIEAFRLEDRAEPAPVFKAADAP